MLKKTLAVALAAATLCAGTAFASKTDELYDRYGNGAAVQEAGSSYQEAQEYTAVLIGSQQEYLDRQDLFFGIIAEEMNDNLMPGRQRVVCDKAVQAKWIEFCNSTAHTGEHILQPEALAEFAAQQARPVLFIYATEDITYGEKKKYDDGRFKTKNTASQRFVLVLADKNGIGKRYDFTVEGDSGRSRDRALVDAFEEAMDEGEKMIFRMR